MDVGICNLDNGRAPGGRFEDGVFGPCFDCLNVILGADGGNGCSSRLRFVEGALASFEDMCIVRMDL